MIVIIYPTGTKRSIHLNHFASEAELADVDVKYITTEQFLSIPITQWEPDTIFLIRVGASSIIEILHLLKQYYSKGFTIFPNYPAIKNCLDKGRFSDLCKQNNIKTPETIYFDKTDKELWQTFPFWEWGQCVIKPSQGTLGSGIYVVRGEDVPNMINYIIETKNEFYENCEIIVQQRIQNKQKISQSIRVFCFLGEPTVAIAITNREDLYNKAGSDLKTNQEIIYGDNGEILNTLGYDLDFGTVSNVNKGGVAGPYFPDEQLKEQCKKICKATGIEFTAIDFVQDQQGEYYCLESNIAPHLYRAYTIYRGKVNHPQMIFDYLIDKSKKDSIML